MKVNKIVIFIVCLCFLVGCQSDSPEIVRSDSLESAKTEIHFLTNVGTRKEISYFSALIEEFEADYNDIRILFESYDSNGNKAFSDLIDQRIKNGKVSDIVTMDVSNVFDYASQGKLLDLSDTKIAKSLNTYARRDSLVGGKIMSLPLSMTSYCMWVNMDILKKCHLELPTNWNEFLNCCKVLKENGYQPLVGTKNFPKLFILAGLSEIYMSKDSDAIIEKLNQGEIQISQYAKVGLEHLYTLLENDYLNGEDALQHVPNDIKELFADQKGVFAFKTADGFEPDEFSFDVSLIGIPGKDKMISLLASDRRIVVMDDSKYKEECETILSYISHKNVQETITSDFGVISAYEQDIDYKRIDSRMKSIYENIENNQVMLIQDYNLKFEQWKNLNAICNAALESKSIESQLEALDELQKQAIAAH